MFVDPEAMCECMFWSISAIKLFRSATDGQPSPFPTKVEALRLTGWNRNIISASYALAKGLSLVSAINKCSSSLFVEAH